jgi:hypothetical protein
MTIARFLIPALVLSFAIAGCAEETDDDPIIDPPVETETGKVRLVHLGVFPGDTGTAVDVFVNGEPSGITFSFKDVTDYVDLEVGTYDFDIVPAGGTIEQSVFSVDGFVLEADSTWSFIASGYVAPPTSADAAFSVSAFQDNGNDVPDGKIRLNVFHTAALGALNPVDVWVVDASCTPVGNGPLLDEFAYGSVAEGVDLAPGALGVGFDVGGDATVDACFQVPDLGADTFVNVFAVNTDGGSVSLLAHLEDGNAAEVTVTP